jgi:HD-GYP domain-containing protein (c-di-GMP phosphodiesterase class II)
VGIQPFRMSPPPPQTTTIEDQGRWLRDAVHRLADELRAHHQPTAEHSHRLARAAREVSERLGLDALEATECELVAIVHDVGKLAVPAALLDHPGALTADDRRLLRGHAVAGADLLARRAGLEHLADPVRHVHETWDGRGYPDGLRGEAIPLLARIVCVVDAYDAMTNHRAYRRALSAAEARIRLAVGAGHQFDPAVVRAYLQELHDHAERRFARAAAPPDPPSPLV